MIINSGTKLTDILAEYPWLADELAKKDVRLKAVKTSIGRMVIRNMTVADAVKKSGYSQEALLAELDRMIKEHGA